MPIHTVKCDVCPCEFKVKRIHKTFVGVYVDKPIYHWFYPCVRCEYKHTVRFFNKYVNPYYDKMMSLKFNLIVHRFDKDKVMQLEREYKVALFELDRVYEEVLNGLEIRSVK
jgi:hypothetical protein